MEKVKNFQRNYLESEKFFSKFSYFLEKGKPKPKSENFQGNLRNFQGNLRLQKSKCKV